MGAVDGKNLKRRRIDVPHPAGGFRRISIPRLIYWIDVGCQPRFTYGEIIDGPQRDPGVIRPLALHRPEQISDYGHGEGDSDYRIDENAEFEEHPAAGHYTRVVLSDFLFFLDEGGHRASQWGYGWPGVGMRCDPSQAPTSVISWSVRGRPSMSPCQFGWSTSGRPATMMVRSV